MEKVMTTAETPLLIEKEEISSLNFKENIQVTQHKDLIKRLKEATKLGNIHHGKIAIIFQADEGLKRVETTIWATGAKYICLKGGLWLPISRISEIRFL
jgi:hypothetical protein